MNEGKDADRLAQSKLLQSVTHAIIQATYLDELSSVSPGPLDSCSSVMRLDVACALKGSIGSNDNGRASASSELQLGRDSLSARSSFVSSYEHAIENEANGERESLERLRSPGLQGSGEIELGR